MKKKNTMQKIKLISAVLLLTIIIVFVWYFIWTWTRLGNNGIEYGELVGHEYISVDRVYSLRFADDFPQTLELLNRCEKIGTRKQADTALRTKLAVSDKNYHHILKENNIVQSMSRKGNCLDNASMENSFGSLKVKMYRGRTGTIRREKV